MIINPTSSQTGGIFAAWRAQLQEQDENPEHHRAGGMDGVWRWKSRMKNAKGAKQKNSGSKPTVNRVIAIQAGHEAG